MNTFWRPLDTGGSSIDTKDDKGWFPHLIAIDSPYVCVTILGNNKHNVQLIITPVYKQFWNFEICHSISNQQIFREVPAQLSEIIFLFGSNVVARKHD